MQIVIHFPNLKVPTPANVKSINNFLVSIVTFDFLEAEHSSELVLDFDHDKQELLQQLIPEEFVETGYESHNSIITLGSIFVLIMFYTFFAALTKIIGVVSKKKKSEFGMKVYKSLKQKFYYTFII